MDPAAPGPSNPLPPAAAARRTRAADASRTISELDTKLTELVAKRRQQPTMKLKLQVDKEMSKVRAKLEKARSKLPTDLMDLDE